MTGPPLSVVLEAEAPLACPWNGPRAGADAAGRDTPFLRDVRAVSARDWLREEWETPEELQREISGSSPGTLLHCGSENLSYLSSSVLEKCRNPTGI